MLREIRALGLRRRLEPPTMAVRDSEVRREVHARWRATRLELHALGAVIHAEGKGGENVPVSTVVLGPLRS